MRKTYLNSRSVTDFQTDQIEDRYLYRRIRAVENDSDHAFASTILQGVQHCQQTKWRSQIDYRPSSHRDI